MEDFTSEETERLRKRIAEIRADGFHITTLVKQRDAILGLDIGLEFGMPQEILRERCMMGFWATLQAYF